MVALSIVEREGDGQQHRRRKENQEESQHVDNETDMHQKNTAEQFLDFNDGLRVDEDDDMIPGLDLGFSRGNDQFAVSGYRSQDRRGQG